MPYAAQKMLITPKYAAKILGCSEARVRELVAAKALPHVRLGKRGLRIPKDSLKAWIIAMTIAEPPQAKENGSDRPQSET